MRAVVHGRVQGVGFRAFAAAEARRLGLAGWVRNDPDGTVTTLAEGEDGAAESFRTWLGHGPPSARVTSVDAEWLPPLGDLPSFRIR